MTQDSVSAIPDRLDSYAEGATAMDAELLSTTASMRNRLEHFQARCTEPGFTVHASGLVDPVRSLAHECDTVDKQVGEVGGRFRMADSRWSDHGGSWHLSAFGALWSTIAEWVPAFVLGGFWSVGTMRVPSWLIGVLPRLPWVQRIWRDGVSSGPGSESLPTGTSRLGELLDSDPAAEAERHGDSQPQGRSRLGELLPEENAGESTETAAAQPEAGEVDSDRTPTTGSTIPLEPADPRDYNSCALYAQARRPDLGRCGGDGGAYNYIGNYRNTDQYYRVDEATANGDLTESGLRPGVAVVWDKGHGGADAHYGHVAIIEEVGADYIRISEANWSTRCPPNTILPEDLVDLHFIL